MRDLILLPVLVLAACEQPPAVEEAVAAAPTSMPTTVQAIEEELVPQFERAVPSKGVLSYSRDGTRVSVMLVAGGQPNGAATPADCAVHIRGVQGADDRIRGHVVPYGEVTAEDIGPAPLKVDLQIGPEGVMVTDHGAASRLCGMGSQIEGFYRRLDTPD